MNKEKDRAIAIRVLNEFVELPVAKGLRIPLVGREGGEEEACLYGCECFEFEDGIVGVLMEGDGGDA